MAMLSREQDYLVLELATGAVHQVWAGGPITRAEREALARPRVSWRLPNILPGDFPAVVERVGEYLCDLRDLFDATATPKVCPVESMVRFTNPAAAKRVRATVARELADMSDLVAKRRDAEFAEQCQWATEAVDAWNAKPATERGGWAAAFTNGRIGTLRMTYTGDLPVERRHLSQVLHRNGCLTADTARNDAGTLFDWLVEDAADEAAAAIVRVVEATTNLTGWSTEGYVHLDTAEVDDVAVFEALRVDLATLPATLDAALAEALAQAA